jgi:hypothetical protein
MVANHHGPHWPAGINPQPLLNTLLQIASLSLLCALRRGWRGPPRDGRVVRIKHR